MRAPLLFDPTGGVFFDTKTNEGTKLTKLGSEGRSTSTTITAFTILNRLHDAGYPAKDQKLLSFTDNRQDAALQAGHFNDFVQVVQMRAGIRKALAAARDNFLTYANIGEAVFKALALPFCDFANRGEEPAVAAVRQGYEETFQGYLFFRALADLRRSWRIVLPNLEQCGLLSVDYRGLDGIDVFQKWAVGQRRDHQVFFKPLGHRECALGTGNVGQSASFRNRRQMRLLVCRQAGDAAPQVCPERLARGSLAFFRRSVKFSRAALARIRQELLLPLFLRGLCLEALNIRQHSLAFSVPPVKLLPLGVVQAAVLSLGFR